MERISVRLSEQREPGRVRREAAFPGGALWWDISGPAAALPARLAWHDMAATGLVYLAMHRRAHLHIDGPVSRSLLEGLESFTALWSLWRPDLYGRIDVSATEEVAEDEPSAEVRRRAVSAFSGGVDASFTLWRHLNGRAGRRTREIVATTLIHGMDIPLDAEAAFEGAAGRARETLADTGIPLAVTRTNCKAEICVDWEMEFGAGVASCLRNWQGEVGYGLLGSDEDYGRLVAPWGGHPLHYMMASSRNFQVVYDGGEFNRTEKVAQIADWKAALDNLRVCWEGPITARNCGVCEKCVRTKLNFLAMGVPLPASLPEPPTPAQILALRPANEVQIVLLEEVLDLADQRGASGPWVDALRHLAKRTRRRMALKTIPIVQGLLAARRRLRRGRPKPAPS